jgi:hypothetical protein
MKHRERYKFEIECLRFAHSSSFFIHYRYCGARGRYVDGSRSTVFFYFDGSCIYYGMQDGVSSGDSTAIGWYEVTSIHYYH